MQPNCPPNLAHQTWRLEQGFQKSLGKQFQHTTWVAALRIEAITHLHQVHGILAPAVGP